MTEPLVSVVVVTWNAIDDIDPCLTSMLRQSYSNYSITIVDNCSTDGTADHVRANYPSVEVVQPGTNLGYRGGNALGMAAAEGELIVVCNDDVEVEREWLAEMVRRMSEDPSVGMVTPMILMHANPGTVNAAGNTVHFTGMTGPRGKGDRREQHETPATVAAVSGCCFMIRRALVDTLRGFSDDFDALDVGWHASFEDVDLGWRVRLAGYRIEYVPSSVMSHKYRQPALFPARYGAYEWGRYLVVLRNYRLLTLVALTPMLVVLELLAWAYAVSRGPAFVKSKGKVMMWLLTHPAALARMRERVQSLRIASDHRLLQSMDTTINVAGPASGGVLRLANRALAILSVAYYGALVALTWMFERHPLRSG